MSAVRTDVVISSLQAESVTVIFLINGLNTGILEASVSDGSGSRCLSLR